MGVSISGGQPGVIKSVQRGTTSMGSGASVNITIAAVNTGKAMVNIPSYAGGSIVVNAQLTSSTNLFIQNNGGNPTGTIAWEVVEFY